MAVTRVARTMRVVPMMRMMLVDTMMDVMIAAVVGVAVSSKVFDKATRGCGLVDSWDDW